jgi:lactoylglutathione lyase
MDPPRLNLVVLRSPNLDRAETFYQALGIMFSREKHGTGPEHLAAVLGDAASGELVFEIYPQRDAMSTRDVRVGFAVASLEALVAVATATGGTLVSPISESPWGLRAVVADPDGHRVELSQITKAA